MAPRILVVLCALWTCPAWVEDSGWLRADRLEVAVGGKEIYRKTLELLDTATSTVWVEMFQFQDERLINRLIRHKKKGVDVRVILGRTLEANRGTKRRLEGFGVPAVLSPTQRRRAIDHVKMVIVDGTRVMIGGANWGRYTPRNFDLAVVMEGSPARYAGMLFEADWARSRGWRPTSVSLMAGEVSIQGDSLAVRILTDGDIRTQILKALEASKRSIDMALYIFTESRVILELGRAVKRGVRVRVVLDPGQKMNEPTALKLDQRGVSVRWYEGDARRSEKFHVKSTIIDGRLAFVGSANLTHFGLKRNHECDIVLANQRAVKQLQQAYDRIWRERSHPVVKGKNVR